MLTEAAMEGQGPPRGLKENVIIGKLIPAGTGAEARALAAARAKELPPEEAEALREREAAMTFLTGEAGTDGDGTVDADEAEAAARGGGGECRRADGCRRKPGGSRPRSRKRYSMSSAASRKGRLQGVAAVSRAL